MPKKRSKSPKKVLILKYEAAEEIDRGEVKNLEKRPRKTLEKVVKRIQEMLVISVALLETQNDSLICRGRDVASILKGDYRRRRRRYRKRGKRKLSGKA